MSIYDYTVPKPNGEELNLADCKGKVILIVNTTTGCGFTPHYEALEKMYEKYHKKGLEVIDIPCNQFGGQTPGTDEEVHQFCTLRYNTQFPQMKKSNVNGKDELPLYTYLKSEKGFAGFDDNPYKKAMENMMAKIDENWAANPDIKWNFTKFVIDRNGNVAARFEPTADMKIVEEFVAALI